MKLVEAGSFPIADIEIGDRLRAVDEDWAAGIAATIETAGLQNPVQLVRIGNHMRLAAGAHRVRAFQMLSRSDIPATIYEAETDQPEMELRQLEIIENIARRDLSPLDRAAHIAELAAIEKALHGETRGGDQKGEKSKVQKLHFWSIGDEIASKMGLSRRSIFADLELHRGLSPATRKRVVGTWLADHRAQLRDLSKLPEAQQATALDLMLCNPPKARSVKEALSIINKTPMAKTDDEKAYKVLKKGWLSANRKVQRQFLEFLRLQGVLPAAE